MDEITAEYDGGRRRVQGRVADAVIAELEPIQARGNYRHPTHTGHRAEVMTKNAERAECTLLKVRRKVGLAALKP